MDDFRISLGSKIKLFELTFGEDFGRDINLRVLRYKNRCLVGVYLGLCDYSMNPSFRLLINTCTLFEIGVTISKFAGELSFLSEIYE